MKIYLILSTEDVTPSYYLSCEPPSEDDLAEVVCDWTIEVTSGASVEALKAAIEKTGGFADWSL